MNARIPLFGDSPERSHHRAKSLRAPVITTIIVNYRTPRLTKRCLDTVGPRTGALLNFRAIVVDGGSDDGSAETLKQFVERPEYREWVEFLPLKVNGGFGWANNRGMLRSMHSSTAPEFIYLLNPDTELEDDAVLFLTEYLLDHPDAAAVGSQLLNEDGTRAGSAFSFPTIRGELARGADTAILDRLLRVPPVAVSGTEPMEVEWATGASVMFRTEALRQAGIFDEGFFLYHEEIELMWRLHKAGWTIGFEPRSRVRHVGGAATGVHSRATLTSIKPRRPAYWFRSRSRFFALTRGPVAAFVAFLAWLLGHLIWRIRRAARLAPASKACDHELRDHLRTAFPRPRDSIPAFPRLDSPLTDLPAWMDRGW